ncbi:BQ2448_7709 [Microbotryum intermedium]|uniref:Phytase A n=1 Tax=Microbotryum intermedium TaxID=269621 RepID=A0A238FLM7_9BASI|nr:BQ2448_7709 [Microbotryum intermedium]
MIAFTSSEKRRTVATGAPSWTWTATILTMVLASELASAVDPLYMTNSGQNSAYFPLAQYKKYDEQCGMQQINLLQLSGAREPASNPSASMQATLAKVVNKTQYARSEMAFLANYTYKLGDDANLIPFGAAQLYDAGLSIGKRYCSGPLGKVFCGTPFLRSSAAARVRESAGNWSSGFLASQYTKTKIETTVSDAQDEWRAVWTPAVVQRLQSEENYGLNSTVSSPQSGITELPLTQQTDVQMTLQDVLNFAYLCAFDSYAINATSPFCGLFKSYEWAYIEYDGDLDKYYGNAYPGAPLSRSQGVGYVNELLARLTSDRSYIDKDTTQVNHTIDSNSTLFPLDKFIYADFTYDNQLLPVMSLIGLFQDAPLSPTLPCPMRSFVASKLVPFAGRMVVERLRCSGSYEDGFFSFFKGPSEYVRILVNDQVMDLSSVCGKDEVLTSGTVCRLSAFTKAMEKATATATKEFAKCGFTPSN